MRFRELLEQTTNYIFYIFIIGIIVGLIGNYLSGINIILNTFGQIGLIIIGAFIFLSFSLFIFKILHWYKRRKTFWNLLGEEEIKVINNYLNDTFEDKIKKNFELGFNPKTNYVSLSGILTQKGEEEKASGIRKPIKNIDKHLLLSTTSMLVSGAPGAGKSTTLYKTYLNFWQKCHASEASHIPIFIHVNDILNLIRKNQDREVITNIVNFIESIHSNNNSLDSSKKFVLLCKQNRYLKFIIIVDALDEFLDKDRRDELFKRLSELIEKTQLNGTRWILSCREDDYRAYEGKLSGKVVNIRLKPMSLKQREEFEIKRIKKIPLEELSRDEKVKIKRTLSALKKAQDAEETFLSNPYYLEPIRKMSGAFAPQ